jgi:hypothetical protein
MIRACQHAAEKHDHEFASEGWRVPKPGVAECDCRRCGALVHVEWDPNPRQCVVQGSAFVTDCIAR